MKLAEALALRKEIESDIQRIYAQITENLTYLEEDGPDADFDMDDAFVELIDRHADLGILIFQINKTNNQTVLDMGLTVMEAIVLRDSLSKKLALYTSIRSSLSYGARSRSREDDLKVVTALSKKELDQEIAVIQEELKRVDLALQEGNWTHDLVEFSNERLDSYLMGGN